MQHIVYESGNLRILDQRRLPHKEIYVPIKGIEDGYDVIKKMMVRGAPAIAIVGLLSLSVELHSTDMLISDGKLARKDKDSLLKYLSNACKTLCESRPTAVNLKNESENLIKLATSIKEKPNASFDELVNSVVGHIEKLMETDVRINQAIGNNGAEHIFSTYIRLSNKATILTHCNTGSLATAGYGTALGVIRALHESGRLEMAYCTETRPYNQGSRLTAFELVKEKIPCKLICDNMAAALMNVRKVDAVVVGADRVARNGDTANKIGTYGLAVIANHHQVPFFVALPSSTFDPSISDGSKIPIEERPPEELKTINGQYIAPVDVDCWNPSFDITPAKLIAGYMTELGVFKAEQLGEKLAPK